MQVIPPVLGNLELIDNGRHSTKTLRVQNNPWIKPLQDAYIQGSSNGFWSYVRSDNYRHLYNSHPRGVGSPPPKRNKDKKISRQGKPQRPC